MTLLESYLALERLMVSLDELEDPRADDLRDVMDPIWYAMSDEERSLLEAREGSCPARFAGEASPSSRSERPEPPSMADMRDRRVDEGDQDYPREAA